MRQRAADPQLCALFDDRYVPLLRLAGIITRDPALAEDLVDDAFVKLVQHWPKVAGYDSPAAWLRRVVIRDAVRQRRRRGREHPTDSMTVEHGSAGTSESDAAAQHLDVLAMVRGLPPMERAVIALHYLEDLSVTETADLLGIAPGTVKAHLSHARDHLRAHLAIGPEVS